MIFQQIGEDSDKAWCHFAEKFLLFAVPEASLNMLFPWNDVFCFCLKIQDLNNLLNSGKFPFVGILRVGKAY